MRKGIGITRVSEAGEREGESFISPGAQENRIGHECGRLEITLAAIYPEINVSGGKPLAKRTGLLAGVEAIEAGEADVLIVAYFDRLVRELKVQWEVVSRVERAGGEVLAVDFGRISEETATQWLSATMIGAVHEYVRRQAQEKSAEAQADAVERGVPPFAHVPPGYKREVVGYNRRGKPVRGPFVVDPATAPVMVEAFERRARRESIREIRDFLRANGIDRSHHALSELFHNRAYLGELHFGELSNLSAHKAIIPRHLFDRVQRTKSTRGRYAKSDRLLARLDILKCDQGARMVVGLQRRETSAGAKVYPYYRCPPNGDCAHPIRGGKTGRLTIAAPTVEKIVEDAVRGALAGVEGRASVEDHGREAEEALERAQANLSAAIRAFAGVQDEEATKERLTELRAERDEAQAAVDQLRGSTGSLSVLPAVDWDLATLSERRDFIRAVVDEVTISPGVGAERVAIKLFVE